MGKWAMFFIKYLALSYCLGIEFSSSQINKVKATSTVKLVVVKIAKIIKQTL